MSEGESIPQILSIPNIAKIEKQQGKTRDYIISNLFQTSYLSISIT